ncbi:MAG: hypothetical protein JOZ90_05720 [Alphaproteobacteria bacterium]|nr:hypothetical protein [Alphaproteobacteria bacterium]MBV9370674.1 hypothetical protein [Alphaproteobacteria bacterium]MBV9900579.1 hypothetical protein [Alphaproteobacteria bacterium]
MVTARSTETLAPIRDKQLVDAILDAVTSLAVQGFVTEADELSSNTVIESVEINPETIFPVSTDRFEAAGTIHVTLNYGGKRDAVSIPDSYPAIVRGHHDGSANVDIDSVEVDTSSFSE